jgi:hypothetical protein
LKIPKFDLKILVEGLISRFDILKICALPKKLGEILKKKKNGIVHSSMFTLLGAYRLLPELAASF